MKLHEIEGFKNMISLPDADLSNVREILGRFLPDNVYQEVVGILEKKRENETSFLGLDILDEYLVKIPTLKIDAWIARAVGPI